MRRARELLARAVASICALVGSRRDDDDLCEEMGAHLDMQIEDNVRRGMTPDEARRVALIAAGGLTGAAESAREQRGLPVFESLIIDVRYAARALAAKPGYTAAVILTLALGIGANSAMFSIVNAVVLRPLPYANSDRLVSISTSTKGEDHGVVDDMNYVSWRDNARSVTLTLAGGTDGVLTTGGGPEVVSAMEVSTSYFSVFAVRPLLGRTFTEEEDHPGGPEVVVLHESLWRRAFGADSSIVGRTVTIDDRLHTVIGILPASFTTSRHAQFWVPIRMRDVEGLRPLSPTHPGVATYYYFAYGRLRDGATLEGARAELATITRRIEPGRSPDLRGLSPVVMTMHERRFGDRRKPLVLLFSAVGVLLIIACANLANLSLARSAGRQREMAVRLALGAGRWRLARALLCESTLLALAGGLLGLLLAKASIGYMVRLSPASVGNLEGIPLDATVLLFTLGVAVLTGLAFGVAPAVAAARGDINRALTSGGPRSTAGGVQQATQRLLVVVQLATALVLLTAAGLVARTFLRVAAIDAGFEADHLASVQLRLPKMRYSPARAIPFFEQLASRVRAQPGVVSVAFVHGVPLSGLAYTFSETDSTGHRLGPIDVVEAGSDYFRTIGATIRAGRGIDSTDRAGSEEVIVVNEVLARQLFPQGSPVGRTIRWHGATARVVGVVKNVLQRDLEIAPSPVAYAALAQTDPRTYVTLMVRTAGAPTSLQSTLPRIVQSIDPTIPPAPVALMTDVVSRSIAPRQFTFVLLGVFAALAAMLAVIGLYGVLANLVADRTREIGIRVALGADARRVTRLVLGQGAALVVIGTTLGIAGSIVSVRSVRALVYDMSVYDPWTFAGGAALLVVVSLIASYIPARRASRVDPIIALRAD
jgi:putative ABC transport system permease protein